MNKQQPPAPPLDAEQARRMARRKRRIRLRVMRISVVAAVLLVLALLIALLVLRINAGVAKKNGTATSFMAVKAIEVEGDTRYTAEDIIRASSIYVGESLLVVNKVQAHDAILEQFPYLDYVEVGNSSFSTVSIHVRETAVLGAVQSADGYWMLGANNHALERLTEEQLPAGTVTVIGATVQEEQLGHPLLDERSLRIVRTVLDASTATAFENLTSIDITEKTNVRIRWKNQLDVVLGNETNIPEQIKALQIMLPTLIKNNGETLTGRLDMTSYADDNGDNDKAVFTPAE